MTIGERVTQLRKERGWSSTDLSNKSKVHTTQISKLESNIGEPSINTLKKIAKALDKELVIEFV